jgi:hypothetical protein
VKVVNKSQSRDPNLSHFSAMIPNSLQLDREATKGHLEAGDGSHESRQGQAGREKKISADVRENVHASNHSRNNNVVVILRRKRPFGSRRSGIKHVCFYCMRHPKGN